MELLRYVCVFAPAALSAALFERWVCKRTSPLLFVELYLSLLAFVNLAPLAMLILTGRITQWLYTSIIDDVVHTSVEFTVGFCVKYLFMGLFAAVVIPMACCLIHRIFHAELVVERHVEARDETKE